MITEADKRTKQTNVYLTSEDHQNIQKVKDILRKTRGKITSTSDLMRDLLQECFIKHGVI
jgi:hypothetical protein